MDQSSGIAGDHPIIYRRGGQGFDRRMMLLVYDGGKVCTRAPYLDRPTNTIFAERLTPETLGKIIAFNSAWRTSDGPAAPTHH